MDATDGELIEAHRHGDRSAAKVLVGRHLTHIRSLLFQLVLDQDAADELTQEVFVSALRNLNDFRGESAFGTWLHRIAINAARQADRKARTQQSQVRRLVSVGSSEISAPEAELMRHEQCECVQRALATLTPQLRAAVVLTVMQGLSAAQAAEIESCPIGTMYWRVHEARRLLRDELKGFFA